VSDVEVLGSQRDVDTISVPSADERFDVVVVGGGLAGLTSAVA
jgi:ribulose 1,5-bisphosphate synthetase/thiazole synthase